MCSSSWPVRIGMVSPCDPRAVGRDVSSAARRLPREARSLAPRGVRLPERSRETSRAVLEQGPCSPRSCRGEEGQDEDVRVPEDVSAVARAGEATGAERCLPVLAPLRPRAGRARDGWLVAARDRPRPGCRRPPRSPPRPPAARREAVRSRRSRRLEAHRAPRAARGRRRIRRRRSRGARAE